MRNIKIRPSNLIFYLGYILIVFSYMFSSVKEIGNYCESIQKASIILLTGNILIQSKKYTRNQLIIVLIITTALFASYFVAKSRTLLMVWLLIAISKNIELKKFIKYDLLIRILFLAIVVALYFAGGTDNYFMYRSNGTIRSSMGVAHPNDFGAYLMIICFDYIYLKQNNIKVIDYFILVAVSFIISFFSDSKTSQFSILLLVSIIIITNINKNRIFEKKIVQIIIKNIFVILTIFIICMSTMYKNNSEISKRFNKVFSNRVSLASKTLENYDIKLFGNSIKFITTKEALETKKTAYVLDNAYMNILMVYGIVAYLISMIASYLLNRKLLLEKEYKLLSIFIVLYFYGFNETGLFKIQFNSFLICLSYLVYNKTFADKEFIEGENKDAI